MNFHLQEETKLAIKAVMEGERICNLSYSPEIINVKESPRDVSTVVDIEIEQAILSILSKSNHPILAEETSDLSSTSFDKKEPFWVVDPIDGTVNFINGIEIFAISVGLCRDDEFLVGAVALPRLKKLYCTLGSDRAFLNGRSLKHNHRRLDEALVAVSFSGKKENEDHRIKEFELFGRINDLSRGCNRFGSAAANICFTASGQLQAAYGFNAKLWDVAGAFSIAIAAGCRISIQLSEEPNTISYIVGSDEVVSVIREIGFEQGLFLV